MRKRRHPGLNWIARSTRPAQVRARRADINPALQAQCGRRVRVERARVCDRIRRNVEITLKIGQSKPAAVRTIGSSLPSSSAAGKPRAFGEMAAGSMNQPNDFAHVALRGERVAHGQFRVDSLFPLEDLPRLRVGLPGQASLYRKSLHHALPGRGCKFVCCASRSPPVALPAPLPQPRSPSPDPADRKHVRARHRSDRPRRAYR